MLQPYYSIDFQKMQLFFAKFSNILSRRRRIRAKYKRENSEIATQKTKKCSKAKTPTKTKRQTPFLFLRFFRGDSQIATLKTQTARIRFPQRNPQPRRVQIWQVDFAYPLSEEFCREAFSPVGNADRVPFRRKSPVRFGKRRNF